MLDILEFLIELAEYLLLFRKQTKNFHYHLLTKESQRSFQCTKSISPAASILTHDWGFLDEDQIIAGLTLTNQFIHCNLLFEIILECLLWLYFWG